MASNLRALANSPEIQGQTSCFQTREEEAHLFRKSHAPRDKHTDRKRKECSEHPYTSKQKESFQKSQPVYNQQPNLQAPKCHSLNRIMDSPGEMLTSSRSSLDRLSIQLQESTLKNLRIMRNPCSNKQSIRQARDSSLEKTTNKIF